MRWDEKDLSTEIEQHRGTTRPYDVDEHRKRYWDEHDKPSYNCPDCGNGQQNVWRFEVHHIDGNPSNDDMDNLIGLCHSCHMRRHRRYFMIERLREMRQQVEDMSEE